MDAGATGRWPLSVRLALVLVGLAVIAVVIAVAASMAQVRTTSRDDSYSMTVWFKKGTSRQDVAEFIRVCGNAGGAGAISGPARSPVHQYRGQFVLDINLPFGPDDERSNPVLGCVDHSTAVQESVIPL